MSTEVGKKLTLKSADGEIFEIEEAVALQSNKIKHMVMDDDCAKDSVIPLPDVDSKNLSKVLEYCKKHVPTENTVVDLKRWDVEFMKNTNGLVDLLVAAKYLDVKELLDLGYQTIANMLEGMSPQEICKACKIKTDFTPITPEEEEE